MTRTILDKATNAPVLFAHVIGMKDGQQVKATSSDQNGRWSMSPEGIDSIRFSSIGYETKNIPINNLPFAVVLQPQIFSIPEAVVETVRDVVQPALPALPAKRKMSNEEIIAAVAVLVLLIIIIAAIV